MWLKGPSEPCGLCGSALFTASHLQENEVWVCQGETFISVGSEVLPACFDAVRTREPGLRVKVFIVSFSLQPLQDFLMLGISRCV